MCLDRSSSYNPSFALTQARATLARQVAAIPRATGSRAQVIYLSTISDNSYDPRELRATIQIPAVPPQPAPPNTTTLNQDALAKQLLHYQHAVVTYRAALAAAQHAARAGAHTILTIPMPPEGYSTDVFGCLQRASDLHVQRLIIASDLDENGQQQVALHHSLRGVIIQVIDFLCGQADGHGNEARACEARKAYWNRVFARSGTTNVQYFTPGQVVGNLFGS